MITVDDRGERTLLPLIKRFIHPGATVKSDEWSSYKSLDREGFVHLSVNHSVCFVTENCIHTQLIESLWSQVKAILKVKRGTRTEMLQDYLDYFSFIHLAKYMRISVTEMFSALLLQEGFFEYGLGFWK